MTQSDNKSRKAVQEALKATVCRWLGWDDLQYGQFQYEMGVTYLRFYLPYDDWGRDQLERTRLFWSWWRNRWAERDAGFCDTEDGQAPVCSKTVLAQIYRGVHDATTLASDIYPGRVIMEETYSQMVGDLIKEVLHD